jgi:galactose-1-phosphate uridylyltransferase
LIIFFESQTLLISHTHGTRNTKRRETSDTNRGELQVVKPNLSKPTKQPKRQQQQKKKRRHSRRPKEQPAAAQKHQTEHLKTTSTEEQSQHLQQNRSRPASYLSN